mmetsp:Transcript_116481/g.330072  ORF Transcript_116481/g.330072 Transcript_116481/m.330072 type:complete len:236 (+) Transcript_116481:563-1270(+)
MLFVPLLRLSRCVAGIGLSLLLLDDLFVVRGAALVHPQSQLEQLPLALVPRRRRGGALLLRVRRLAEGRRRARVPDGRPAPLAGEDRPRLHGLGHPHVSGSHLFIKLCNFAFGLEVEVCLVDMVLPHLAAADDGHCDSRLLVLVDRHLGDCTYHVHALDDLAERDVPPVELGRPPEGDEELRAVAVAALVRHAEDPGLRVPAREVLVVELPAVDALAAVPVVGVDVAGLHHEALG